ncbi:MAG: translation initiation factor [Chthoniobacteraceae bacterium]|nr:translation initiation factor [Chthoniobacteraceae bacterium]
MSRPNKSKISTSAQPGGGLFQAFSGLEMGGLPSGPEAGEPQPAAQPEAAPSKRGRVVLRRETAHRGGKTVLVIDGFDLALDADFLENLAKRLRSACGCGGCVKERTIELQGDQPARVREKLVAEGFRVAGER